MLNVTAAAVKNAAWQGTNGIITEGSDNSVNNDGIGFKGLCFFMVGTGRCSRCISSNLYPWTASGLQKVVESSSFDPATGLY